MQTGKQGWCGLVGLLVLLLLTGTGLAQVPLTTVQDTVYSADGTPAQGTVVVSWTAFTTAGGSAVAAGSTSVTLGAGGALSIGLAANAGGIPTGTYYTAVFHLSDGTTSRQFWVVPAGGGPVKLAGIESQVLPTSVAMQTVSKSYVDNAVAKAVTGVAPDDLASPYVVKAGSSMLGPLLLPGDPVSPLQAADKNYVDTNIAAAAGGLSGKVSVTAAANQSVVQTGGTQLEINSLNGVLDATGFLNGNGNDGIANALRSANCINGCEVRAGQNYPGTEGVATALIPSGAHLVDRRGGGDAEIAVNPLSSGQQSNFASAMTMYTTRTAQQAVAARPGIVGPNSYVMSLTQNAPTGGSNQFPLGLGALPYNKSNYGVLALTGNYSTQGQHVQFDNMVNCYSVGDCLAGGQFILSSGGYRDPADEGTHPFDLQVQEDSNVFQGTCTTGCTTGATNLLVSSTGYAGTQGDGRFLMDKNPGKVISTGFIAGNGGGTFSEALFSGTNFPVSVFLQTASAATAQPGNMQPGTITMPIATSGVPAGFGTSTGSLPATQGVACVADPVNSGKFPNFETVNYQVADATHVQLTLNKVHNAGATIAVGGLCGYGLEQKVDTQGQVRQIFPVIGSVSATALFYAGALSNVIGGTNPVNTSGYLNVSMAIAGAARSGGVVTLTLGSAMASDLNGLQLTVSGVADASYNGTYTVTTTGNNTLTYAAAGADGSSNGGTVGAVTGGYALYPMAEVLNVLNPANATVDGTMTLAPNTVAWAAGDPVEEPHYYQQLVYGDTEYIGQYVPRPLQYTSAGKFYGGQLGPGARGWQITNGLAASNYLGAGGTHQPPDAAFLSSGVWRRAFEMDAGQDAALLIHCNLHTCSRWDSAYSVLLLDSQRGQDFLNFDPRTDTAWWNLAGSVYTFAPNAFSAPAVSTGTLQSTSGAPRSVLLGGATTSASPDVSTVIGGNGASHVLELLSNNGTARNTFTFAATLNGTATPLFEIGSGMEENQNRSFYLYDYGQSYVPLYASATSKSVGINTTTPAATLDVSGNLHATSVQVGTGDTQLSRTAAGTLSVDDGNVGDSNGSLSLASVLLKDTANGHVYRLTVTNGALTTTQVQ